MAERTYTIKSTDGTLTFDISPREYDGVGGADQNSDLLLPGSNHPLWGDKINQSMLRVLENFACEQKDVLIPKTAAELGAGLGINSPIVGQLWFNKTTQSLNMYTSNGWAPVLAGVPGGLDLATCDVRYVKLAGDTLTGFLTLHATPTEDMHAATKQYVDDAVALVGGGGGGNNEYYTKTESDSLYVKIIGDTMTGFLTLVDDPQQSLHAATKQYVDTSVGRYVRLIGDTMSGPLILSEHPTVISPALQAATKQYVDAAVAAGGGGGGGGGETPGATAPPEAHTVVTATEYASANITLATQSIVQINGGSSVSWVYSGAGYFGVISSIYVDGTSVISDQDSQWVAGPGGGDYSAACSYAVSLPAGSHQISVRTRGISAGPGSGTTNATKLNYTITPVAPLYVTQPIPVYGEVTGTSEASLTSTITTTYNGVIILTGYGYANYTGGVSNAGNVVSLIIDEVPLARDRCFEGETTSLDFHASTTTTKYLTMGTHVLRMDHGTNAAQRRSCRMSWVVIPI